MPRRRNKVNKPPLTFAESPVHIVHNPPDLVFASDNPPTADVVSLGDDVSVIWVSPQFHGNPATPGPKRRRNKSQQSTFLTTRQRHRSGNSDNTTLHSRPTTRKFPVLKFIGDETVIQDPSSPEIQVDVNENLESVRQVVRKKDGQKSRKSVPPPAPDCNTPDTQQNPAEEDQEEEEDEEESLSESPMSRKIKASTAKKKKVKVKKKKSRLQSLAAELDFTPESENDNRHVLSLVAETVGEDANCSSDHNVKRKSRLVEQSGSPLLTQLRHKSIDSLNRKRLFSPRQNHDVSSPESSQIEKHLQEFDLICPRSMRSTCTNLQTTIDGEELRPSTPVRSTRLHHLKRNVFSPLLRTPKQDNEAKQEPVILAYDTPEEEYGLTVRQRNLRSLKRQRRKKESEY